MKQFGSEGIETPFDMPETPEGWQIALLGQIAQIVGGGTPKTSNSSNFSEGEYPWITPADLSGFNKMYISRGRRSLSKQGLKTSSALLMPKGTVLMSSRAPIGYLAIAANELCTNQGFKSFICSPGVTPEHVFFWLKLITPFLENMGSGSTFLEISGSRARKIPILLAPTSEQKRIVAKVEELLTRVNATKDRLAKVSMILKRFRQAVLSAACSGRLTAHWHEANRVHDDFEETTIGEIAEYFGGFAYKSQTFLELGRHQVIRIGNVRSISLNLQASPVFIPGHMAQQTERFRLLPDDIVISMTGTKYKKDYGYAAIVRESDGNLFLNQRVAGLRCGDRALPKYLLYWLQTGAFRDFFFAGETGNVNQGNVGVDGIRKAPIELPSLCEQQEIVRRVETLFKLANTIERRVGSASLHAEKLTQAILAKAFRGQLVPTEAEIARREARSYESASEILARIKSERESRGASKLTPRNRNQQKARRTRPAQ